MASSELKKLTAILTLADALDRSNRNAVSDVRVRIDEERARLEITPARECNLEMWDATRKAPAFERVFGLRTEVVLAPLPLRTP